jgi:hypothetical protein
MPSIPNPFRVNPVPQTDSPVHSADISPWEPVIRERAYESGELVPAYIPAPEWGAKHPPCGACGHQWVAHGDRALIHCGDKDLAVEHVSGFTQTCRCDLYV